MRVRIGALLAIGLTVAVLVGIACTTGTYSDETCSSFGGACVTSSDQCGGSLPFPCTVGMCCVPNGMPAPDAASLDVAVSSQTSPDSSSSQPGAGRDASPRHDASASSAPDAGTAPDGGAGSLDAGHPPYSSGTPEAGHDAGSGHHDAGTADAGHDAGSPRDAGRSEDAGAGCAAYAAPGTPAACTACTSSETCQANGCYGGYFCHTTTDRCVLPTSVVCDAG
jgi:hypothetical protein